MHAKRGYQIRSFIHLKFYFKVVLNLFWGNDPRFILHNSQLTENIMLYVKYVSIIKERKNISQYCFTLEVFVLGLSIKEKKIILQITNERIYRFK